MKSSSKRLEFVRLKAEGKSNAQMSNLNEEKVRKEIKALSPLVRNYRRKRKAEHIC